ncbi:hypothetical protein FB381_1499 [Nocardioides albertanoniae]|uniref:DUF222 domain-containing protein n=1 Tax=Nocardioides albertanoniae TaxID=1175486 RepID=A0A543A4Z9_9ACTN|nr:13E12 repeat family protein [Nocardioides albertanoniae]TQL67618.1 hypothetical protein FB381_1499 [Nocardioides albertanoniae]
MSVGRGIDHWGNNPGDSLTDTLDAVDSSLDRLLASDPIYWDVKQKKTVLAWLEKVEARQAALRLRVLASAGDIAAETGDKDASAWMRAELLVDKGTARTQIKLAAGVATYELVADALATGDVSQVKARVITKALADIGTNPVATTEDLALAEKLLVDYATRLTANELRIIGKRILAEIDPARFEDAEAKALLAEEERAHQRTALRIWDNHDGTVGFDGVLPASVGYRFKTQVEAWAQPRKQQLVEKGSPLPPWGRLMGQGFARLLETIDPDALPRHGGDATTVNVVISLDDLRKDLGTATLGFDDVNGPRSQRPRRGRWPATPRSSPGSSAPTARSSTRDVRAGSSNPSSARRSGYSRSAAGQRGATCRRSGATRTTWTHGQQVGRPI